MNRIILIGNGFDLAHKIKTSYHDFITDYWKFVIGEINKSIERNINNLTNVTFENEEIIINILPKKFIIGTEYKGLKEQLDTIRSSIGFKNKFFKELIDKYYLNNWVEIENEYYNLLKKTFKNSDVNIGPNRNKIIELNNDFNKVKLLLIKYLYKEFENFKNKPRLDFTNYKEVIGNRIYQPLNYKDFSENSLNQIVEQEYNLLKPEIESLKDNRFDISSIEEKKRNILQSINTNTPKKDIRNLLKSNNPEKYFNTIPVQTLFLNFNYTDTDFIYNEPNFYNINNNGALTKIKFIRIHGSISNIKRNPIIFGYGDELDDDYKQIEKLNRNEYLENIKSINYLETSNYKSLLEFINSDFFQVYIFGHSCGTSDRTLLNTIFEHDNCATIKVFYHLKNETSDNFSDVIRNISRNFNDKAKMRDRVVNKNQCEPLF
jgi:hypothetical protein